jgi:hypothetical protein
MMKFTKVGVKLGSHCTRKQTTNTQLGTSIVEIKLKKITFQNIIWTMGTFLKN